MKNIQLKPGKWLYANCADMPSDNNCQMVMMAPANQRADMLEAAVAHSVKTHGHQDSEELRNNLDGMFIEKEVE
jgi:hypothetical protein